MDVKVKKLKANSVIPTLGSKEAAGMDLYACPDLYSEVEIAPHETVKIGTGLAMEIPTGYAGLVFARSGLATKSGLRPANCVGVVDSDYRGEIIVAVHNDSSETRAVCTGDRIAQLVIVPYLRFTPVEVNELSDTERGSGGFGHTGI